ncbi:alpha/beta hydrolase [Massilia niabensis]|uniref:Alpha/beta hydrolase n=1 Tax=Massilia niabensis TaxID=544910 RepID=A0ABW0L911_9BURK
MGKKWLLNSNILMTNFHLPGTGYRCPQISGMFDRTTNSWRKHHASFPCFILGTAMPGPVVLVLPDGGLRYVAIDKEGHEVARWLDMQGIAAAVLKYRTARADAEPRWDLYSPLLALGDAGRAVRLLRHHAAKWGIDPNRIAMLGFLRGGTMAIRHTIDATDGKPDAADAIERMSSRPDSMALVYATLPDQKLPRVDKKVAYFIVHERDGALTWPVERSGCVTETCTRRPSRVPALSSVGGRLGVLSGSLTSE